MRQGQTIREVYVFFGEKLIHFPNSKGSSTALFNGLDVGVAEVHLLIQR